MTTQSEIKIEQGRLDLDARDFDERHSKRLAADIFNANSEETAGAFIPDIDSKGFKFAWRLNVRKVMVKMKTFCYA